MPALSATNPVVALYTTDWHIDTKPPRFRAEKGDDWYRAMGNHIRQVRKLQAKHDCVVIHGGDLFDHPNQPPELLNWLADKMPCVVGVPGQHDLFHHRLDDIKRSAWWSMVEMGRVRYVEPSKPLCLPDLVLHGFPWGIEPEPCELGHTFGLQVAVSHRYTWAEDKGYKDAPEDGKLKNTLAKVKGYDVALFGDNHTAWSWNLDRRRKGRPAILNPGSLMVRHSDQVGHKPCVGLIHRDGTIERHFLDTSKDKYCDDLQEEATQEMDLSGFVDEAEGLKETDGIDFGEACRRLMRMKRLHPGIEKFIILALEDKK